MRCKMGFVEGLVIGLASAVIFVAVVKALDNR